MKKGDLLISIITPYYNTLENTKKLASVLVPQLKDNMEWVIVDDGCCEKELDTLGARVIHLEKNSGCASIPRNVGLDNVYGRYILFIDSDDLIRYDYIDKIVEKIKSSEFDYCYISWSSRVHTVVIEDMPPEWNCSVWNCIYKRDLIGDNRFDRRLRIGEDYDFNLRVRKGVSDSIKDIIYFYDVDTNGSLSDRGQFSESELELIDSERV